MITTKITIKPHLAEYCIGKWGHEFTQPVSFPANTDLYITIYDLLQKRPKDCQVDSGNLEIVIPNRRTDGDICFRKNTEYYNYLSEASCKYIESRISLLFWAELHQLIDDSKQRLNQEYSVTINLFICKYRIESITEDALLKNFYRWRNNVRKRDKRKYQKKC